MVLEEETSEDELVEAEETNSPGGLKSYKFYNDTVEIYFDPIPHVYYKFNDITGKREDIDGVTTVLNVISKPYLVPWAAKLVIETLKTFMFDSEGRLKTFSTEELYGWMKIAKDKHKERLTTAGDIGHLAHNALEVSILYAIEFSDGVVKIAPRVLDNEHDPVPYDNLVKAQNCANGAYKWMQDHNVRWLHTERKVYSKTYNYSGTLDGDALIDSCTDPFCKGCQGRTFKDRRAITDWKSSNQLSDSYAYQTAAYQFAHIEEFGDMYIPDRWIMRLGKEDGDFECWYLPDVFFEADINAFLAALNLHRSLDEIEERRRGEKKAWTAKVRLSKQIAREAAKTAEKEQRAAERDALKAAKDTWDAEAKAFYKSLRALKTSKVEAEAAVEAKFPKADRPGAKEDKPETKVETDGVQLVRLKDRVPTTVAAPIVPEVIAPVVPGQRVRRVWRA